MVIVGKDVESYVRNLDNEDGLDDDLFFFEWNINYCDDDDDDEVGDEDDDEGEEDEEEEDVVEDDGLVELKSSVNVDGFV